MSKVILKIRLDETTNPGDSVTWEDNAKRWEQTISNFKTSGTAVDIEIKDANSGASLNKDTHNFNDTRGATHGNFNPSTIKSLKIVGKSEDINRFLRKLGRAIFLKRVAMAHANGDPTTIPALAEIIEKKDPAAVDCREKWNFCITINDDQKLKREGTDKLILEEGTDFDELLDVGVISKTFNLETVEDFGTGATALKVLWSFRPAIKNLDKLEELLDECYIKFGTRQRRKGSASPIWYTDKNAIPFTQKDIHDLATKLEEYSIYKGGTHKLNFTGVTVAGEDKNEGHLGNGTSATATKAADDEQIKSILYNLQTGAKADTTDPYIYKEKIDGWLAYLHELYNWRKGGFEYNWEVLIALRLGFHVSDVADNFRDKKFMGFEVLKGVDGKPLEIEKAPAGTLSSATDASTTIAGENGFRIRGSDNHHNEKYTNPNISFVPGGEIDIATYKKPENQIRALRALEVKDGGGTGTGTPDPFWADWDSSGTPKSIFADPKRVSRQDLFGFQPQDIKVFKNDIKEVMDDNLDDDARAKGAGKFFIDHNLKDEAQWKLVKKGADSKVENNHLTTLVKFTLADANSILRAVRIAFAGGFDSTTKKTLHKLEPEIPKGTDTNFNGISHTDKLSVLKDYYDFIKGCSVKYTDLKEKYIPKGETLGTDTGTDESQDAVNTLDGYYDEAQKWVRIWDTDYSSKDRASCEADKTYLNSIKNQVNPSTVSTEKLRADVRWQIKQNEVWMESVEVKITKIDARINELENPAGETLNKLIAAETREIAKKIFEAAAAKLGGASAPSEEIKELANLVEKVKGETASAADLRKLKEYQSATDDTDEKKKAWEIANEVKDSGIISSSTNGAGADALQKMLNDLQTAKTTAKTAMDSEGGDTDNGAYKKIGIEEMDDVAQINKITQMFNDIKGAYGSSYDKDATPALKSKLDGHKTNDATEWGKIEQYQKNGKGFGTGALEHLSSLDDKQKLAATDLKNKPDGNSVMETWKNTPADKRDGIDKETAERLAAAVELEKKGETDEEKELGRLLGEVLNSGETYFPNVTKDSEEGLRKITDLINKLESYVNSPETDNKGKAVEKIQGRITDISDAKAVLNAWINQLKTRKETLEQQKKDLKQNDDKNNNEKGHLAKHWWKYSLGSLGVGAVIGLGWLAFKGDGEEGGEGGDE
ncbi:MAG: hypothetical protein MRERC_3c069 [Mycoplasmataceae bacterium RC_NB112A]|nr:MAG: hypothetical protein MRERC_3c069 [Mycoplasmataceae bacterium RC_NB112A]